jgi:hypothetical protein
MVGLFNANFTMLILHFALEVLWVIDPVASIINSIAKTMPGGKLSLYGGR